MSAILKQKLIDIANGFTKYGLWKGGGSGGSSALSEMTDVKFTNLQANDVLKYNGSEWVNDDNLHEYSPEEKIVGKWLDGKPIYEKTYSLNNINLLTGNNIFGTTDSGGNETGFDWANITGKMGLFLGETLGALGEMLNSVSNMIFGSNSGLGDWLKGAGDTVGGDGAANKGAKMAAALGSNLNQMWRSQVV